MSTRLFTELVFVQVKSAPHCETVPGLPVAGGGDGQQTGTGAPGGLEGRDGFEPRLTPLQFAQLECACNYNALLLPGARIRLRVSIGAAHELPLYTHRDCVTGEGFWRAPVFEAHFTSTALFSGDCGVPLRPQLRFARLGAADQSVASVRHTGGKSFLRRAYWWLEQRSPELLEHVRENVTRYRERDTAPDDALLARVERAACWSRPPYVLDRVSAGKRKGPAILVGMHWLQTGGAERWALETVRLVKEAGFLPLVVTDKDSVNPLLTSPVLRDATVITFARAGRHGNSPDEPVSDPALMPALIENFDIRGIVVHHNSWLYSQLPQLCRHAPQIPVVDSLHIVEYLGGGYPGISAHFTPYIESHHVVSPHLRDWMVGQGVAPDKLCLAPLHKLSVTDSEHPPLRERVPGQPFTVSFVGRLSRQKRPDVFLRFVKRLRSKGLNVVAVMHGDGELRELCDALVQRYRLGDVVARPGEDVPVSDTLAKTDLLVISSINEGLTLTTFEALAAGVPVASSNVGSQATIVRGRALLPRAADAFMTAGEKLVRELAGSERARRVLYDEQLARLVKLQAEQTAGEWMKGVFAGWNA